MLRRYVALATKNLRRRPVRTGLTVAGVALAVTVEPVDHRIALDRFAVIARQENAEVPRLAQDFALMCSIRNEGLGRMSSRGDG